MLGDTSVDDGNVDDRHLDRLPAGWSEERSRVCSSSVETHPGRSASGGPVLATDESPQTRELLRAKLAGRDQIMDAMITALGDEHAVSLAEAQAIFRGLAAPGLYRELVEQLGWTPHRLADWMSETLQHHLLRAKN